MPSIIELYDSDYQNVKSTVAAVPAPGDLTPYYSEGNNGNDAKLVDEKQISKLESSLGPRYGKGMGTWGAVYNDQKGKTYHEQVKKD